MGKQSMYQKEVRRIASRLRLSAKHIREYISEYDVHRFRIQDPSMLIARLESFEGDTVTDLIQHLQFGSFSYPLWANRDEDPDPEDDECDGSWSLDVYTFMTRR